MPEAVVALRGHIIDSLILPKVLDAIHHRGGTFELQQIDIGKRSRDPSYARLLVRHAEAAALDGILRVLRDSGADLVEEVPARFEPAPADGVLPDDFYATTNLPTQVRLPDRWLEVASPEMDCCIVVDPSAPAARTVPMADVAAGELVVVGHDGLRVTPLIKARPKEEFEFMASGVSTEKPHGPLVGRVAAELQRTREAGGRVLVVGGPAIIHTGSGPYLEQLIAHGFVQVLFAGNALATHDIESALYGTSLGVSLAAGTQSEGGHEHHLHAINRIRAAGGIRQAVEAGLLTSGVMHACVVHGVDFVLAGSIRDDGPLPEVISDVLAAQQAMRRALAGVEMALLIATALHSIATGNLLPATVRTVCVDIDPKTVTKLADRGSLQTVGLVTDAASFLRELCTHLGLGPSPSGGQAE
jgi:lysine-ketoglutarate reductase/saccharopine dehydrogenase-like protein (TIGR00300 family)